MQACYTVVRISALAQRAEYIWADGLEGADSKVCARTQLACVPPWAPSEALQQGSSCTVPCVLACVRRAQLLNTTCEISSCAQGLVFNEMRSKTKVIQVRA